MVAESRNGPCEYEKAGEGGNCGLRILRAQAGGASDDTGYLREVLRHIGRRTRRGGGRLIGSGFGGFGLGLLGTTL